MSLKLPNDKIVYNLQEQVGVNAANIEYLARVYKEIDSIPAQYADLKEDFDTNIKGYFDDTMTPTFNGWTTTFEGWTETLDTYLANMSSAAVGALAGQDVSVKTISQTNPNYNLDFNFTDQEGATIENIYNRFEVINNVLYMVINMKLTNNGASPINIYQISSGWKYLDAVAPYIYDLQEKTVAESRTGQCVIASHEIATISDVSVANLLNLANGYAVLMNGQNANVAILFCRWNSGLTIAPGDSVYITGRLFLTLL